MRSGRDVLALAAVAGAFAAEGEAHHPQLHRVGVGYDLGGWCRGRARAQVAKEAQPCVDIEGHYVRVQWHVRVHREPARRLGQRELAQRIREEEEPQRPADDATDDDDDENVGVGVGQERGFAGVHVEHVDGLRGVACAFCIRHDASEREVTKFSALSLHVYPHQ